MMLLLSVLPWLATAKVTEFQLDQAMPADNLKGLNFVSRFMIPYGPDIYSDNEPQASSDRPYRGYGFGMNAAQEIVYDPVHKYVYAASELGWVLIVDYEDPSAPKLTNFNVDVSQRSEINDIAICPEHNWLFVPLIHQGVIDMYQTVQRDDPADPILLATIEVGKVPAQIIANTNCTLLAVSNEQKDEDLTHGTVTIVRDLDKAAAGGLASTTFIPMDAQGEDGSGWDDDYTLRKGLHMPLTKSSLEYWDTVSPIAEEADFTEVREKYRSSFFVQGEALAWSGPNESELLVNLQVNNGMMRIDVARNQALALAGYGLKDHSVVPVDINPDDKKCDLRTYANLFSMRNPDTIATLRYNDKIYLLTANEGASKEYGAFEDEIKARELFLNGTFGLPNVKAHPRVFDPSQPLGGPMEPFHADCVGDHCVGDVRVAVGSSSIDYERDPQNPTFQRLVMQGGRGWTIYELPEDPDALLKLVFDSGDDVEHASCEFFPWAYNSIQDEEMGPGENMPNNTLWRYAVEKGDEDLMEELAAANDPEQDGCADQGDGTPGACPLSQNVDTRSAKGGLQVEHVVSGVACGRLVALVSTEKESIALLYDITNIASPDVVQVFQLSHATENKSAGLAYNDGTIGEIDPESFVFLSASESPTGKASVIFAGAFSGTLSYWEFECGVEDDMSTHGPVTSAALGWAFWLSMSAMGFVLLFI